MKVKVSESHRKVSNGAQLQLIGYLINLEVGDSAEQLFDEIKGPFLAWKAQYGNLAVMLKASVRGASHESRECFESLLTLWNGDEDIKQAPQTLIDIEYFEDAVAPLCCLTNNGQVSPENKLEMHT